MKAICHPEERSDEGSAFAIGEKNRILRRCRSSE
jgi:hypothetical protein